MQFTSTFSALLVVLPLMAHVSGLAVPEGSIRQRAGFGGKGAQGAKGAQGGAAASAGNAAGVFKVFEMQ